MRGVHRQQSGGIPAEVTHAIYVGMRISKRIGPPWRRPVQWAGILVALTAAIASPVRANDLPPEVRSALQRARVPEAALSVVVQEAGTGRTVMSHQARQSVNPASLLKLVPTYAALDLPGPAWSWSTTVGWSTALPDGVLVGDLFPEGTRHPLAPQPPCPLPPIN